jgi:hypothetical protein
VHACTRGKMFPRERRTRERKISKKNSVGCVGSVGTGEGSPTLPTQDLRAERHRKPLIPTQPTQEFEREETQTCRKIALVALAEGLLYQRNQRKIRKDPPVSEWHEVSQNAVDPVVTVDPVSGGDNGKNVAPEAPV